MAKAPTSPKTTKTPTTPTKLGPKCGALYKSLGWQPIPLRHKAKRPKMGNGWQDQRNVPDHEFTPATNVGVILGEPSKRLIDVDLDCVESVAMAADYLPPCDLIFGRGVNATHYVYMCDVTMGRFKFADPTKDPKDDDACLVELRGDKHETMFPPSIHPAGEVLEWRKFSATPRQSPLLDVAKGAAWLAAATLVARAWNDGQRDDLAVALFGMLAKHGLDAGSMEDFLAPVLAYVGDEEASERLGKATVTEEKHEAGEELLGFRGVEEIMGEKEAKRVSEWMRPDFDPNKRRKGGKKAKENPTKSGTADAAEALRKALGMEPDDHVLVAYTDEILHVPTRTFYDRRTFNNIRANVNLPRSAWDIAVGVKDGANEHVLRRVVNKTFSPGMGVFIDEDNQAKVNTWRASGVEPGEGDVQPFLDHIRFLCNSEDEAEKVLDYLTCIARYPGRKIKFALVIKSERQGIGKSFIGQVMRKVLGDHNVRDLVNEDLQDDYGDWMMSHELLVVEELKTDDRYRMMRRLKAMITQPTVRVRMMRVTGFEVYNRFNFLMFTNEETALAIDEHDRRYFVIDSPAIPRPAEYYRALFQDWLPECGPAMLHYFLSREITHINPDAEAPMTEGKREMIQASKSALENYVEVGVARCEAPFHADVIITDILRNVIAS